ncbi:MAG: glycosyl hydrolase family 88 [Oscillospiraceae bacterium]|jgi:rhamnogalacturonyl hydrolase YesR|nr:glycosyl hydrolase family 88 [Oscillospiraceae bacterium]
MSKKTRERARIRAAKARRRRKILLTALSVGCVALLAVSVIVHLYGNRKPQFAALKNRILASELGIVPPAADGPIVFLSVCDSKQRAYVAKGKAATLEAAWKAAEEGARKLISQKNIKAVWVKADIVSSVEEMPAADLHREIAESRYPYFFRKGISFDPAFDVAFLEGEVNANRMLRYTDSAPDSAESPLNLSNINQYLKNYGTEIKSLPENVTLFSTAGFFCGLDGVVIDLYNEGLDAGRRVIDAADDVYIKDIIISASQYLSEMIQPGGQFIYGYFPNFDHEIDNYNILRHTGSIWSLLNYYRMTGDTSLIAGIDSAVNYLLETAVEFREPGAAYVVERKDNEVKLGGSGLAVIMLTEYMDVFGTDTYIDMVRLLADGILELQDPGAGTYYHVLNYPDYSPKAEFRTIYYDGEATFALTRAYTYTREQKYLDGAAAAVENFIANDYARYRDHWVAYALNEITQYLPEPRYYEFALKNVSDNLNRIYNAATLHPTYLELLMAGWRTHERLLESGVQIDALDDFDVKYFAETVYKRAFHMLNGYFYPEYAMYMRSPGKFTNAFFVREDSFRIRIDDIQHYIGGNYYYTLYYDQIRPYLTGEFLDGIHKGGLLTADGGDGYDDSGGDEE